MSAVVNGTRATLSWTAPPFAIGVLLEAGTSPLSTDVFDPFAGVVIDRLLISMSNDYSGNPMGIDNLAIGYSGPP